VSIYANIIIRASYIVSPFQFNLLVLVFGFLPIAEESFRAFLRACFRHPPSPLSFVTPTVHFPLPQSLLFLEFRLDVTSGLFVRSLLATISSFSPPPLLLSPHVLPPSCRRHRPLGAVLPVTLGDVSPSRRLGALTDRQVPRLIAGPTLPSLCTCSCLFSFFLSIMVTLFMFTWDLHKRMGALAFSFLPPSFRWAFFLAPKSPGLTKIFRFFSQDVYAIPSPSSLFCWKKAHVAQR